jgi:hypothetical protein
LLAKVRRAGEVGEERRDDAPLGGLHSGGHRSSAGGAEAGPGRDRLRAVRAA